jgi:AraC-like DNA-binding protein
MPAKLDQGRDDAADGLQPATTASVTYHLPAEALRGAVTTYYLVKVSGPGTVWDQIFPEWPNFRIILEGEWNAHFPGEPDQPVPVLGMSGALERALWAGGSAGVMVGVGLMPQGWPRFTTLSADATTNLLLPLSEVLGPAADELYAKLMAAYRSDRGDGGGDAALYAVLDEVLLPLVTERPEAAAVGAAHAALQDPQVQTVADWAERVGLSARSLERFSLKYFGLSPKRLLRRQRMLRTLAAMREKPDGTWTEMLDAQFADQAHFIHEFNFYMGMSPKAYLAREQPFMAEAWKRRKALLGAPVQVLQPPSKVE